MSAPIRPPPQTGNREFDRWSLELWRRLSDTGNLGLSWSDVSKVGSALTDIETRTHAMLQSILGFDSTSPDSVKNKHISNADAMRWEAAANSVSGASGTGTFAGPTGVVVTFTEMPNTEYIVVVSATSNGSGHNGDIWFAPIDETSARIYNSGTAGSTFKFKVLS